MSQQLYFNLLTFDWPQKPITLYFSFEKIEGSVSVYKSNYPNNIKDIFPNLGIEGIEEIYTTFDTQTEGFKAVDVIFNNENTHFYKRYLNHKIITYFKSIQGVIVTRNFVKDPQIWINKSDFKNEHYWMFEKFSLKIQFNKVSEYPELIISYDDTSKVLKKSITELLQEVPSTLFKRIIKDKSVFNYQKAEDDIISQLDLSKCYPLTNRELTERLGLDLEAHRTPNRYIKFKAAIDLFVSKFIIKDDFKKIIPLNINYYLEVEAKRIGKVDEVCNELVFKDGVIGRVPKTEFSRKKPLAKPPHRNIELFFIYHESHADICKKLDGFLQNGTGTYFKGLTEFANIPYHPNNELFIEFQNKEEPVAEIINKLSDAKFNPDVTYVAIYISPFGKHTEDKPKRKIYYRVKEELLKRRIVSQVIDYEKLAGKINNYQFELNNISLAMLAKLQGKPWQLSVSAKKELVIGIGAFKNVDENINYIASAFSFQNNGTFNAFDYFTKTDTTLLSGAICNAIERFAAIEDNPNKVVIHFYKEMNEEELRPIIKKMERLKLNCPLYIVNINKTDSEDIIAFDTNWQNKLMPKSGTYIKIGWNQFLLFNNSRYQNDDKYPANESYPFPIKLQINSPSEGNDIEYYEVKKLIEQVYQFSRLYWKSLRQQNVPITIKYPEMVAEIAPHFESGSIPPHGKEILWFL